VHRFFAPGSGTSSRIFPGDRARPATSGKITLSGLQTVDSIALKDRALAMNQATAAGSQE
jgi:hypothetical protein